MLVIIFSTEGNWVSECHVITPTQPIKKFLYRCGKRFNIEPILNLFEEGTAWGLIIVTGTETEVYRIQGTKVSKLADKNARITKNQKKGGQSAPRFSRIREELIHNYVTLVNEEVVKSFIDPETNQVTVSAILIAGPGDKKNLVKARIDARLKDICYIKTTAEKDILATVLDECSGFMQDRVLMQSNSTLTEFFI